MLNDTEEEPFKTVDEIIFNVNSGIINVNVESESGTYEPKKLNYSCTYCFKSFSTRSILQNHIFTHTGEKPYVCDICNKSFTLKGNLATHKLIHEGKKKYSCDVCSESFTLKITLQNHHVIHSGLKPYVCEICHWGFAQRSTLRKHYLTHTGEKPHVCLKCNRSFAQKFSLDQHNLTHSLEKLRCHLCGKTFRNKCEPDKTVQTDTAEKSHICNNCSRGFRKQIKHIG